MPRRCALDPGLPDLLHAQDNVVHRRQALAMGFTRRAIEHRLATRQWSALLPSVYLAQSGSASRRQLMVGALHYAGDQSAIDDVDACRFHGMQGLREVANRIHVVVPWGAPARSRGYVIVRRTKAPIVTTSTQLLRYVDPATAVIAATRRMRSERAVLAAISEAVQRRLTNYDELVTAHVQGPPRNACLGDDALEHIAAGAHSVTEADFLRLVAASTVLPAPMCNPLVRLPAGRLVSPDALFVESGVVHETNGRVAHEREDLFEDMQTRHDALTAAGFTVLHNSPRRLRLRGREVIAEVERCHLRHAGRGLPDGVVLLRSAAG